MNFTLRQKAIIEIVARQGQATIAQIKSALDNSTSIPTINRDIAKLVTANCLAKQGSGRATYYEISPIYGLFASLDVDEYFSEEADERKGKDSFNYNLFTMLGANALLTSKEKDILSQLRQKYRHNITTLPHSIYLKELERLTIELSWKSSQIEGNTYSLLETERLFVMREEANNKSRYDAIMLLNHKYALEYLLSNKDIATNLSLKLLEEIHSILTKDLGVSKNIRSRAVGITGTIYKPIDNEHQIRHSLEQMCNLINNKDNCFEKALLATILISYIQPFEDGNKRTGRMISNAILIANGACPLSYRNIDAIEYKKAMLIFYEQNNLFVFKKIFIEQNIFSSENYFC